MPRDSGSHRRALSPADKPRDAEAMDVGVAAAVDDKLAKRQAEAGVKPKKPPEETASTPERRRG